MKFIVDTYGNVSTVRLHPDTKKEIYFWVLWNGTLGALGYGAVKYLIKNHAN